MLIASSSTTMPAFSFFFFFNDPAPTEISTLPLHAALPILLGLGLPRRSQARTFCPAHFVQRLIQVLGDMKAVQHMQRLFRLLRQNLQIRLPHVTAEIGRAHV